MPAGYEARGNRVPGPEMECQPRRRVSRGDRPSRSPGPVATDRSTGLTPVATARRTEARVPSGRRSESPAEGGLQPQSRCSWHRQSSRDGGCLAETGRLGRLGRLPRIESLASRPSPPLVEPKRACRAAGGARDPPPRLPGQPQSIRDFCGEVLGRVTTIGLGPPCRPAVVAGCPLAGVPCAATLLATKHQETAAPMPHIGGGAGAGARGTSSAKRRHRLGLEPLTGRRLASVGHEHGPEFVGAAVRFRRTVEPLPQHDRRPIPDDDIGEPADATDQTSAGPAVWPNHLPRRCRGAHIHPSSSKTPEVCSGVKRSNANCTREAPGTAGSQ
jgi:hypothetical protein